MKIKAKANGDLLEIDDAAAKTLIDAGVYEAADEPKKKPAEKPAEKPTKVEPLTTEDMPTVPLPTVPKKKAK